eukprot:g26723.t1
MGGLSHRADLFRMIKEREWPVTALDLGRAIKRPRIQDAYKLQTILKAFSQLGYAAAALGQSELKLAAGNNGYQLLTLSNLSAENDEVKPPYVGANVQYAGQGPRPLQFVEAGGKTIGVTAVFGKRYQLQILPGGAESDLKMTDAKEAIQKAVAEFDKRKPDLRVLLSHATYEESQQFAKDFPGFDIILTAGGPEDGKPKPEKIGKTLLLNVGLKGKHVGVLGYYPDNKETPFRFELVDLDGDRFKDVAAMHSLMDEYQTILKDNHEMVFGDVEAGQDHPSGSSYVGAQQCGECHKKAYNKWKTTKHAKAYEGLLLGRKDQRDNWIKRNYDPECLACHVTGWDPEKVTRYKSGFQIQELAHDKALYTNLKGQQCENCHGPGSEHVTLEKAWQADPDPKLNDRLIELRKAIKLTKEAAKERRVCYKCHDLDNSPKFDFDKYWKERLSRHAADNGADGVMAIPPVSIALGEDELLRYYERIVRAVEIPVIVQDASGYVGRPMSIELQARILSEFGSRIKFKPEAVPLGPRLTALREATEGIAEVFEGSGGIALVDSYRRGVVGTMPGGDVPDAIVALWKALQSSDDDRTYRISLPLSALIAIQTSLDAFLAVEKYLLVKRGIFKNTIVRGPIGYELDAETRTEVDRLFELLIDAVGSTPNADKIDAPTGRTVVRKDSDLEKLFTRRVKVEGGLTEGPAVAPDGSIYFSDIFRGTTKGMILRFDPKSKTTTVFAANSHKSNGLIFNSKGELLACEGADYGGRGYSKWNVKTKTRTVIANRYKGKRFNAPNDICLDSKGRMYVTDPRYLGHEPRELKHRAVYRIEKDGKVIEITHNVSKPNGIALSPDEKTLYVADHDNGSDGLKPEETTPEPGPMKVYAYPLGDDGLINGPRRTLVDFGKEAGCKSTLLKIILGDDELDSGEIIKHPRLQLGYLRQHDPFLPGETALEFLMRDSGQPDWKCGEVAAEFELKGAALEGPLSALSGGWQTRVKLAALLLHDPNLLLLDEPTNFLDLRTQILLEHFLRHYKKACLIVSHDRSFLNATCDHTLDLSRGKLTMYPGPINAYLEMVEEQRERDERTNATVIAKQKQLQRFIDKNRANANTASQARSKARQLERLQTTEIASDEPTAFIRTPVVEPRKGAALRCADLSIGYPDHTVATGIDLEIEHGERALIVGDNGQGKTTFLRSIVDSLKPLKGSVRWGYHCDIGVYAQHVYTTLPPDRTVQDHLEYNALPGTPHQTILAIAGSMLFRGQAIKKKIKVLSGGERARLCMAGLLLGEHNVLILDEPGNHLDVDTVEALASALVNYQGTVIFTSHDRHFMKRVATCVIEVRDGSVRNYGGDYDAYLYSVNKEIDDGERERNAKMSKPLKRDLPNTAPAAKRRDERKVRKELSKTEKAVARLDQEKTELNNQLLTETDAEEAMRLHTELTRVTEELANAEQRWLELQEELEAGVHDALSTERDTGYSTTLKMMQVMLEKGLLKRDTSVRPQLFRAGRSKQQTQLNMLDNLTQKAFSGICLLSLWNLGGWLVVHRLRKRATTPAAAAIQRRFRALQQQMRISRPVQLLESLLVDVPMVVGWLRPVVLFPVSLVTSLTASELDAVIAHELAHIRRHDYLINLLQTLVETLLFFHPMVWWLSRRIRIEREFCCDDAAIAVCDNRTVYAKALAAVERNRTTPAYAMSFLGAEKNMTLNRVKRILGGSNTTRQGWLAGVATLLLFALLVSGVVYSQTRRSEKPVRSQSSTNGAGSSAEASSKQEKTAEQSAREQFDPRNFRLELFHHGASDKPFYSMTLSVPPARDGRSPFSLFAQIKENEARAIIDHLSQSGFFRHARRPGKQSSTSNPRYELRIHSGKQILVENLGWDLDLLRRLDSLQRVLGGQAEKSLEKLLGRLSGYRSLWTAGKAVNGLQTRLTVAKTIYSSGQPIPIQFSATNAGNEARTISDPRVDFTGLTVTDENGRKLPNLVGPVQLASRRVTLAPGKTQVLSAYDLAVQYYLRRPGRYHVQYTSGILPASNRLLLIVKPNAAGRDSIKILEDTDGDGKADKITTFADGLNIPIGLYPCRDGVIAYSIPDITFFRDTNGDGKADKREVLYGGLGTPRDVHGMQNAFRRGFDGWLYICHGFSNSSTIRGKDGSRIDLQSGNTYRVRLDGSRVEQFTWGQVNPFGMTMTEDGDIFTADCHSHPLSLLLRGGYYSSFGKPHDGLGFVKPVMSHTHGSTAISGAAVCTGNAFPEKYRGSIFVGNVMTGRVHRDSLARTGATVVANEEEDFLTCDDPWFRPVDIQFGPDGAMYVADFYNRIIGHYEVPLDHPGRDRRRGRIWRIVYTGNKKTVKPARHANLATADTKALIESLADSNLTVRMLATDQLSDRVGNAAVPQLRRVLATSRTATVRVHAMWALHRLEALTPAEIVNAARADSPLVRIHAMRVLSERSSWNSQLRQTAIGGLSDRAPLVCRAAADALGQHPHISAVPHLLASLRRFAGDAHLKHTLRIALRNHLRSGTILADIRRTAISDVDRRALAEVAVAVPTDAAGAFLVDYLKRTEVDRKSIRAFLSHAAKHLPRAQIDALVDIARKRVAGDVDLQLSLLVSLQNSLKQRGLPETKSVRNWGSSLATSLLASIDTGSASWGSTTIQNPWGLEKRNSADGKRDSLFLSSLPGGESKTGVLRSKAFKIPARLRFYICGHLGFPNQPASAANYAQLRLADSGRVIAKTSPPRNDLARQVDWRLEEFAGKQGYFEVVDGMTIRAYAWIAVSRFDPPVLSIPKLSPRQVATRQVAAATIARQFQLRSFEATFRKLVTSDHADWSARAAAARALAEFRPDATVAALAELIAEPVVAAKQRAAICRFVAAPSPKRASELLAQTMRDLPTRLQNQLANKLSATRAGGEVLMSLIQNGKASPRLLQDTAIRQKLLAAGPKNAVTRIKNLTASLPAVEEETRDLIAERLKAFHKADASPARGRQLFSKNCAVCHQVLGKGAVIGPQLDGIGNRGLERIVEDVLDPNRNVDANFHTTVYALTSGKIVVGQFRRREGKTLVVADEKGREIVIAQDEIDEKNKTKSSIMPANVGSHLKPNEFYDLVAYLLTLKKAPPTPVRWKVTQLDPKFRSEGVAIADVNRDGKPDVLAGEFWYEAPEWKRHEITTPKDYGDGSRGYSSCFAGFADDINADGWPDFVSIGFPGAPCHWFENPRGKPGHWKKHVIWHSACNETPLYADLFGTGKRVLIMGWQPAGKQNSGQMAYFTPGKDPTRLWTMHPISRPSEPNRTIPGTHRFAHGLGAGDMNGDGRKDVICTAGWWEQPAKLSGRPWTFHRVNLGPACANMVTLDIDGDGKNDVLSSSAHQFGIWWHQHQRTKEGPPRFKRRDLFPDLVSQTHALVVKDIDGDGLLDFVTGKRWWAHGPKGDPGSDQPAILYWFQAQRQASGSLQFIPRVVHTQSGIGTQFSVGDLNNDKRLDIVVSNKKGVFIYEQYRESKKRAFLPPEGDTLRGEALLEFIKIDIEYHWRFRPETGSGNTSPPFLEDYVSRFPELGTSADIPVDLIAHEYRTRCWSGDQPEHAEYLARFPTIAGEVAAELQRFDSERSSLNDGATPAIGERTTTADRKSTLPDQVGGSAKRRQAVLPREFGDYEILDEIARGGMGVVYRARQRSLNRIVALKVIVWGGLAGEEEVRRFRAEAESAARLEHPNIVPIFEVGQYDTHHFFTMAFVDGPSLSDRVVEGPLPPRDAARLIETIARAIQYAHDRDIVHRDIKPGNVLLAHEPDSSIPSRSSKTSESSLSLDAPRITDFGLAKQLTADEQWTTPGLIIGTPGYMPPEQAEGRIDAVGPVSDVYSLGATLYCLLTGRPPFQAATPLETVKQVATQEPVSPKQLNPAVDRDVETICLKCIEKSPSRRYQSAAALADDLNRYLTDQPIHARPILPIGRLARWVKRNRLLTISASLIVLSLAIGLIGTLAGLREARHQFEEASDQRDLAIEQRNRAITAEKDADAKRIRAEAAETRANAQTVIANNATQLANKRFDDLKTEAFKTMFQRLDDADRLRNGTQLRRNLAKQALEQLKRLAEDTGQTGEVLPALVDAYIRLAAVQGSTDRLSLQKYSDAVKSYQAALKILSDPALPEDTKRVWERTARCRLGIASALTQMMKIPQARSEFKTARGLLEEQLRTDPENNLARTMLVEALQGEGMLAFASRKTPQQAIRPFQNALQQIKRLTEMGSVDERTRIRHGVILFHLAVPSLVKQQLKDGLQYFEKARDVLASVSREHPANLSARAELIITCLNLALIGRKDDPKGPWRDSMKKAIDTELSMVDLSVDSYLPVKRAAGQLQQMSTEMARSGEAELALQLGHKAVFLYKELTAFHPDQPTVRIRWANALTRLALLIAGSGRHDEGYDLLYASQRTFFMSYRYDIEFEPIRAELLLKSGVMFLSAAMDGKNKKGEPVGWEFRQRQLRRAIDSIRASRNVNLTLRAHLASLKKSPPSYLQNTEFLARVIRELDLARAEFEKKKEPGPAAQIRIMAYTFSILSTKLPAK